MKHFAATTATRTSSSIIRFGEGDESTASTAQGFGSGRTVVEGFRASERHRDGAGERSYSIGLPRLRRQAAPPPPLLEDEQGKEQAGYFE